MGKHSNKDPHGKQPLDAQGVLSTRAMADRAIQMGHSEKQKSKQQFMWIKTWERVWKLCEYWTNTQEELKGYRELEECVRVVMSPMQQLEDHQAAIKRIKELLGVDEDEGQDAEEGVGPGEGHEAGGVESVHQGGSDPVDDGGGDRPA